MNKDRFTTISLALFLFVPGFFLIAIAFHFNIVDNYLIPTTFLESLDFSQSRFIFVENTNFTMYEKNNLILFYYFFISTGLLVYFSIQFLVFTRNKNKTNTSGHKKMMPIVLLTLAGSFYFIDNIHHPEKMQLSGEYIKIESLTHSPLFAELIMLYCSVFFFILCFSIVMSEVLFYAIRLYRKTGSHL